MTTPLHVLIVAERDDDVARLLAALERAGFAPTWQHVADPARYLIAIAEQPQVIIAADSPPPLDPPGALRLLREQGYDIPVIAVSGGCEEAGLAALRDGAVDYLLADRLGRLGPAIERALAHRRLVVERRRAEQVARLHQRRFRAAFDHSPVGMVLTTAHGYVLDVNPAFRQLTGHDAADLRAGAVAELVAPEDRALIEADGRRDPVAGPPVRLLRAGDAPVRVRYASVVVDDGPEDARIRPGGHVIHLFNAELALAGAGRAAADAAGDPGAGPAAGASQRPSGDGASQRPSGDGASQRPSGDGAGAGAGRGPLIVRQAQRV